MQVLVGGDYPIEVIKMIDSAKFSIDVVSYDWRWYGNKPAHATQQLNLAILRAVARGVRVRAVLNVADQANFLATLGIKARGLKDKRVLHCKMIIFDQKKLVIGSHNLTSNAFYRNLECSVVIELPEGANRIVQLFDNLYTI